MKKQYQKPVVENISFQIPEELMNTTGDGNASGGVTVNPFLPKAADDGYTWPQ